MHTIKKNEILILLDTQLLGKEWSKNYIIEQITYTLNLARERLCPSKISYNYMVKTLSLRSECCIMAAMSRIMSFVEAPDDEKIDNLIRSMYHELYDAISDYDYRENTEMEFTDYEKTCYFAYLTICIKILKCIEKKDYTDLYEVKEWYRLFIECYSQSHIVERYFPNVGSGFFFNRIEQMILEEQVSIKAIVE